MDKVIHSIPNDVLLHHTAILGKTGSGKTSTEKLLAEQAVEAGFRVCVLDPIKSDWWGITSSANGKKPGLPFKILGGPRGHVPLHSSAGKAIGRLVGTGQLPLSIIDMADFEPGGLQRFFIDFATELMRSIRGVVYLVIEEAHEFAPKEKSGIGGENMATHLAKKLATAGRSKGIRLVVATQRTQALHNAVLGSCETVIVHRLTAPADQKPVLDWLKANADKETTAKVEATLASLPTGTGWVCSGEARIFERMPFPKFATFDNTATPTNDADAIEVTTATVDQDELRAIIGDAVKEAEANDPKRLRARITELERQIGAGGREVPAKAEVEAAERRGYDRAHAELAEHRTRAHGEGLLEGMARVRERFADVFAQAIAATDEEEEARRKAFRLRRAHPRAGDAELGARALCLAIGMDPDVEVAGAPGEEPRPRWMHRLAEAEAVIAAAISKPIDEMPGRQGVRQRSLVPPTAGSNPAPATTPTAKHLKREGASRPKTEASAELGAERKPLSLIVGAYPAGYTEAQWASLAGFKRTGGTWGTYKSRLRSKGMIEQRGDLWFASEDGCLAIGADVAEMPSTPEERLAMWKSKIAGVGPMLDFLFSYYPTPASREFIADNLGFAAGGGTFGTYLSRLRSNGLLEEPSKGMYRLASIIMGA